jgi:hypothetical protein
MIEELKNKLQRVPAYLHSDRGGEFSLTRFLNKLQEYGVSVERGPADSPQTNGVSERFNGVLLEKVKCMLLQSQVPQSMWHKAVSHASTLLNVLPHLSINWVSPTSVLVKQNSLIEPDRTNMPLVPFGAWVVAHRLESLKILPKGVDFLFLGFEPFSDAARFYDPLVHCVVISQDYVIPNVLIDADINLLKKDLKSLPQLVSHRVHITVPFMYQVSANTCTYLHMYLSTMLFTFTSCYLIIILPHYIYLIHIYIIIIKIHMNSKYYLIC